MATQEVKKKKEKVKEPDITLFHGNILEMPKNGELPFLKAYRCKKCGDMNFKTTVCMECWNEDFEMVPLPRKGKVYSYSDIYIGQQGMETPYIFAYIDFPEGLRLFSQLEGEVGSYKCDEEVELTVGPIRMNRDGLPIDSYKFKKIDS